MTWPRSVTAAVLQRFHQILGLEIGGGFCVNIKPSVDDLSKTVWSMAPACGCFNLLDVGCVCGRSDRRDRKGMQRLLQEDVEKCQLSHGEGNVTTTSRRKDAEMRILGIPISTA